MDMITAAYAQSVSQQCAAASTQQLAPLITAATQLLEGYCGRSFHAQRYPAETYDMPRQRYMVLRNAPLVQLNLLTLFPDTSPQTFTESQFDILGGEARLSFKPTTNAGFGYGYFMGSPRWPGNPTLAQVVVDYFAGFGFVTALTAAISAGVGVTLPLAATSGFAGALAEWRCGAWSLQTGQVLILDDGTPQREEVTITVTGGVVTATTQFAHASGAYVAGAIVPAVAQAAAATVVANMLAQPDLTKKMEGIGRIGGVEYQTADPGRYGLYLAGVSSMLAPFREGAFA